MSHAFRCFLLNSVYWGIIALLYLIFKKSVGKRISPGVTYPLSFILISVHSFPFALFLPETDVSAKLSYVGDLAVIRCGYEAGSVFRSADTDLPFIVWFAVFAAISLIVTYKHIIFVKTVRRWSDKTQNIVFEGLNLRVMYCPVVSTPLITGLFRKTVLLPDNEKNSRDYNLILKHESVHYKRGDILLKFIALAVCAANWFNPVVWLLYNDFCRDCELSCDLKASRGLTPSEKREYADLILRYAAFQSELVSCFSLGFSEGGKFLSRRICVVMDNKKNGKICLIFFFVCLTAIIVCFLIFSVLGSVFAGSNSVISAYGYKISDNTAGDKYRQAEDRYSDIIQEFNSEYGADYRIVIPSDPETGSLKNDNEYDIILAMTENEFYDFLYSLYYSESET